MKSRGIGNAAAQNSLSQCRARGESQKRIALRRFLDTIIEPLNRLLLRIKHVRKIQKCLRVGDFHFFFRPFIFSDLLVLFLDYEPFLKKVFKPQKGDIVFDVGAHIGIYTLKAAKDLGEDGIVVAFEPDDENFRILQKNIRVNQLRNVKLIKAALGKFNGETLFSMTVNPLYSCLARHPKTREVKKVQMVTLDNVVEKLEIPHIDWIKIDVEGAEMGVLEGGDETYSRLVRKVIIETQDEKAPRFLSERKFKIDKLTRTYFFASRRARKGILGRDRLRARTGDIVVA